MLGFISGLFRTVTIEKPEVVKEVAWKKVKITTLKVGQRVKVPYKDPRTKERYHYNMHRYSGNLSLDTEYVVVSKNTKYSSRMGQLIVSDGTRQFILYFNSDSPILTIN